jgi:alpha-glucosidase
VYWNTEYDWPECRDEQVKLDGYFFAYGDDYKQALQDFVTVFGRIPMIPRWALGFWYSRWYAYKDQEYIDLVKRYRKEGIPIDVMVFDTDWRDGWGGYDWSGKYFKKPEKTIAELHEMGCRVGMNDHPGYDKYDALPPHDSHIPAIRERLGPLPHQGQYACDWSNKKAVEAWKDILLGPFFDQGLDFWWIDGWVKPPFGQCNSQLWSNQVYYELGQEKTNERGLILARWGGIGSHRFPVQFSGDTLCQWGVLKHEIEYTPVSAGLGAVYWSHDIGGFMDKKIDEELFIRWVQFGAMSPIFRTHSAQGIREPWKFSARAKRIFRKQTHIRYALTPYLYTLTREAYDTGMPICRPMFLDNNKGNAGARDRRWQYMLGPDLLVVPGDEPVDKSTQKQRKRVFFPSGRWFGLETTEVIQGMEDGAIDIPVERIPCYVREGAIIPSEPVGAHLALPVSRELHFDFFPAQGGLESVYTLYEDDGTSMAYADNGCARTQVKGSRTAEEIVMSVGAPQGRYKGMPDKRTIVLRMRIEEEENVAQVEIRRGNGSWEPVAHKHTCKCLACGVESGQGFCEVRLDDVDGSIRLRARVE